MATPSEKRALRLMKALKSEFDRCGALSRDRPIKDVAPWFIEWRHRDEVLTFVRAHRLVQSAGDGDAMLMLPSDPKGLDWIASQQSSKVTLERVGILVAIVFTIAAFAWGVFVWLIPSQ